ncbi:MAG: AMP-binding protein [Chloroflexota bacterium]
MPGMRVRVLGEDGVDARRSMADLFVERASLAAGYRLDDVATTAATFRDGWLHTRDLGRLDADGRLWVLDRLDEMMEVTGGENVSPAEVEAVLATHPAIADVAVVGSARPALLSARCRGGRRAGHGHHRRR